MPSLNDIPGYGAYIQRNAQNRQAELGDLQQASGLMGILKNIQAQQEQQQLKSVLAQAGGDPAKAVAALLQAGTPQSVELASKLKGMMPKPAEPYTLGNQRRGPNNAILAEAPFRPSNPEARPELLRLQDAAAKYPEGHPYRAQIQARIKMLGERPTGVTVNMPASSDTVQGPDGKFYKFRIGKDGKPEVIPFQTSTGDQLRPPETPAAAKAAGESAAEAVTLTNVRSRIEKMSSLIQGGGMAGGVVGPQGLASRVGETAVGIVHPGVSTPALDYQNEMRLLLSD